MFCSTVVPTIGRPELARAVNSVLTQSFMADDFEVVVVNDSGMPLPKASWQSSGRVRLVDTQRRERCVARNVGAAMARGKHLHFLDDDDWLLPGALSNFWALAQTCGEAAWLYGGSQLVDRSGNPIVQLHHRLHGNVFVQVMAGEWIPLQASLIHAETFFAVGGFHTLVAGIEDIDLCRRIALRKDAVGMPEVVACIGMGLEGSTTDYARAPELGRWARESILSEPGAFERLCSSAGSSYWSGRVVRAYLTSAFWNLQRRHGFRAMSRATFGMLALGMAGARAFSKSFWRAVAREYESETFLAGFRDANQPVERRKIPIDTLRPSV
jgi:glycosyltransferase involved in cell wall biosynthesis